MPYEREGYAPWSLTREAGVQSATVDGTVKVPQYVQPTLSTGFVDEKGNWQGSKSNDEVFIGISKAEGIAHGGDVLFPDSPNFASIDMTGFSGLVIAIKPTRGGTTAITAVMGPDTKPFANLSPVNPAVNLKFAGEGEASEVLFYDILNDTNETLTADVWNIYTVLDRTRGQKNMQIKITNDTGGASDYEFGFMRLV